MEVGEAAGAEPDVGEEEVVSVVGARRQVSGCVYMCVMD